MAKVRASEWWEMMVPEDFWYLVGLIAADGCLFADGRHVDITAKDASYLRLIKRRCDFTCSVTRKFNTWGNLSHHVQISSRPFHARLVELGLMSRKSKRLGPLGIPSPYFSEFLRGVIDGDGSIRVWRHPSNGGEQWSLRISGASRPFLEWLKNSCKTIFGVEGKLHEKRSQHADICVLKFGKMAAQVVLKQCYYEGMGIVLKRKAALAFRCCASERGWSKSKTVLRQFEGDQGPGGETGRRKGLRNGSPLRQRRVQQLGEFGEAHPLCRRKGRVIPSRAAKGSALKHHGARVSRKV